MYDGKFILVGEDKKSLSSIKNALCSNGFIFLGYLAEQVNLLRFVRVKQPDFIIIDIGKNFKEYKNILETIDEDILAACILLIERKTDDITEFLRGSRIMTYVGKPVFDEVMLQIVDLSLINYFRIIDYEKKVSKLNDSLESRKIVEKAKWLLIEKEGFTEASAYEAIKKKSRNNRMTMREIAEAIILTRG